MMTDMNYLEHHGILGQKWGIRRYQNSDGTLTAEGKKRYSDSSEKTKEYYSNKADTHRKKAESALKVSISTGLASIPAALITSGMIATTAALSPVAIGGLAVTTLLSGTAGVSRMVAIGEAIVSDVNYNKAKHFN